MPDSIAMQMISSQFQVLFRSLARHCDKTTVTAAICDAANLSQVANDLSPAVIGELVGWVFDGATSRIIEIDPDTRASLSEWLTFLRGDYFRPRFGAHVLGLTAALRILIDIDDLGDRAVMNFAGAMARISDPVSLGAALAILGLLKQRERYDELLVACSAATAVIAAALFVQSCSHIESHGLNCKSCKYWQAALRNEWRYVKELSPDIQASIALLDQAAAP